MVASSKNRRRSSQKGLQRTGALLSAELIILLPVLAGLMLACGEFALVLSANQKLKQASHLACRIASRPCTDPAMRNQLIREAIHKTLSNKNMVDAVEYELTPGFHTGDDVVVEIHLPMRVASPDLLAVLGFSLEGRDLHARTVMAKE